MVALGLLFLTDLRGHDIVLGKLAATSLRAVFGLVAIVPVAGHLSLKALARERLFGPLMRKARLAAAIVIAAAVLNDLAGWLVFAVIRPAITSCPPIHRTNPTEPNTTMMTMAVSTARMRIR